MLSHNSKSLNRDCTVQISLRFGSMIGYKDNGQKRIQSPRCTLADIHMLVLLLMMEKLLLWQVILKKNRQIAGLFIIFVLVSPYLLMSVRLWNFKDGGVLKCKKQSWDELWFVKKCLNCTFKVNFLSQKSTEFFLKKNYLRISI